MFSVLTLTVTVIVALGEPAKLTPEQEQKIRNVVVTVTPKTESPNRDFLSVVTVPDELSALYKENATGVLELLLRIADGANPVESVTASTYALALLRPQGGGAACIENFKKATYDVVDKSWETTPRYFWIGKIKKAMKSRE